MNVKLPVFIGLSFGVAALVTTAQPAMADVSIEIISRSGSARSLSIGNNFSPNPLQPSPIDGATEQDERSQQQSEISLESEESAESPEDDFEGILIRI